MSESEMSTADLFRGLSIYKASQCGEARVVLMDDIQGRIGAADKMIAQAQPLSDARIEFGLENQLEDPSDDEAEGFRAGVRFAEAAHKVGRQPVSGLPYGIIDPDYARVFTKARCLAWSEGYALAMHGSFTRDLDLIAIPWANHACEPEHLVARFMDLTGLLSSGHPPSLKPHGRRVWTFLFPEMADPRFVDFGVMPRAPKDTTQ